MTTPLRRQYLEIKRRYPHALLFFRLGDFYETFDEDAKTVARELEITLTSRPMGKGERAPLAGIPHHSLDAYLGKLIARGYKVAVCEQTEAPVKGKKLVDRRVVRVVTPGTLVEDDLLESATNNYLAALAEADGRWGLAYADVSTGEFACLEGDESEVAAELGRLAPAETLSPQGVTPPVAGTGTLTPLPAAAFADKAAEASLLEHFGAASLEALGLAGRRLATRAAGALIGYLRENQPAVLGHVTRLSPERPGRFMSLDASTVRNLEIFEPLRSGPERSTGAGRERTLLGVLDLTKTAMGARLLRRWLGQPSLDRREIGERQDGVAFFESSAVRQGRTAEVLGRIGDVERSLTRVSSAAGSSPVATTPRDLVSLRRGLGSLPALRELIGGDGGEAAQRLLAELHTCGETASLLAAAIADDPTPGAVIRDGFSDDLDGLRGAARDTRQYVAELEGRERERTGIKTLKVGYNRVFGYYIEVTKAQVGKVPPEWQRKQTLVGGERYTTEELRDHEYKALQAKEREEEVEGRLLRGVCDQVAAEGARILEAAGAVALIDVLRALAEAASRYGYVRPAVDESDVIALRDGRHPVVERLVAEGTFVPNDTDLSSSDAQVIVLTGPNMAGKSTYLRQVALIALMAQVGSFVPAAEARIGIVDRIASRVGALDDIAAGHSTFMVEMLETAAMLNGSTARSLLVFDEIGRGTSTYDGMAIARAVVEFIHNRPGAACRTLFATHYHELTDVAASLPRVRNFSVAVAEEGGEVVFLHRILPGGADRSYGVYVARLAGLPRPVVQRAEELLAALENGDGRREAAQPGAPQLALFAGADAGLREELAALEPDEMTPLEALRKLYDLAKRARR
ncbi:MAG: DNA mismatch repair protein MutS [Chloroflexi bacterium]|nr:DNA mismatch repair protein MutS [Chloroflexota bacterium]MCI0814554.1 DNA mismatch repair protein MutS [Chloroflexota bacterium]MCI0886202.1 DNA mismatch repair protein MutS [Chloroflexota bacterium]